MDNDITMCANGQKCPKRNTCYRFLALPSGWQSVSDFYKPKKKCEYFWLAEKTDKVRKANEPEIKDTFVRSNVSLAGEWGVKNSFSDKIRKTNEPGIADPESILLEAHRLVNGDRDKSYGGWEEDFTRTAKLASIMTKKELTAVDILKIMVAVKLSRSTQRYKRDNLVDACGYLEGWNELEGKINDKK